MTDDIVPIGRMSVSGSPTQIGAALGARGGAAVARVLCRSSLWHAVTSDVHGATVARMADTTRALFPAIHDEIAALAEGLALPLAQVFAWNARGDLLAGAGDGCTTVQLPGPTPVVAHNEDGLPGLRDACFLAEVQPDTEPGFMSFCYPGSIPGHSFAVTETGLVVTVNNLRLNGIVPEVPRMVLTRALLSAPDRKAAVSLLRDAPPSGGFHLTLGQAGAQDIWSVTFGGGEVITRALESGAVHSNHAQVEGRVLSHQTITASSRDRLERGRAMVAQADDPLDILNDTGGAGLPILRQAPDDPDDENTLAQFHARIGTEAIDWQVHEPGNRVAAHAGRMPCRRQVHHA
ncbi:MAG: C45 family peptidase [Paracoccaceae bacterium]